MQLHKLFVVFIVALTGRICQSKIMIEINEPDGFAELEEAAIQTLTTCYANQDKTIVLLGNFPGNFIKRLSSYQSFSLVLLDDRRRTETLNMDIFDFNRLHETHVVVAIASSPEKFMDLLSVYRFSIYNNPMAFFLALGWSPINKYGGCDGKLQTIRILYSFNYFGNQLNLNLLCRARTQGIVMYSSNPFINQAPKPWRLISNIKPGKKRNVFSTFVRKYRKHEGMCKNLDFDRTHDLGRSVIAVQIDDSVSSQKIRSEVNKAKGLLSISETNNVGNNQFESRRDKIDSQMKNNVIYVFITYVNATGKYESKPIKEELGLSKQRHLLMRNHILRATAGRRTFCSYPYGVDCSFLVTQFRGNKSQLRKIYDVIDNYSWIGMYMAYFITLMFFKYFLRQPLIVGILNLCRLTCNFGLTTLPPNAAPQIYLACLLFFVVTMQGIFVGNLAALLTHDIPVRQVNTIQDLIDLGYTVYATKTYFVYFNDPVFKGRLMEKLLNKGCIHHVLRNSSIACLTWGSTAIDVALENNLHISTNCIATNYYVTVGPWIWPLKDRFNKFIGIMTGAGTIGPFNAMVDQMRLFAAESEEIPLEPRVMTMRDLGFAFVILGVGLLFAIISFIIEVMIYRYHRRVTTTRVIVLN